MKEDVFERVRRNVLRGIKPDIRRQPQGGEIPFCSMVDCKNPATQKKPIIIKGEDKLVPVCREHV